MLRGGRHLTSHLASDVLTTLADRDTPGTGALTPRRLADRSGGLRTTADLIRYAFEHGLIVPPRQS